MGDAAVVDHFPSITIKPSSHPDAQATVTDFSDYTEYFPSDLVRSLTLIEKLETSYTEATQRVHDLTKHYGEIPDLHPDLRPGPLGMQELRKQISEALEQAILLREAAAEEARRLSNVTERYYYRLGTITRKLKDLPKPPSRDPTPAPVSPSVARNRRLETDRAPRLTLQFDGDRRTGGPKQRSRRLSRADEELGDDYDIYTSDSDMGGTPMPKTQKIKIPKMPKARIPGMGTNVHSAVAGISTSNALALLTPPPADVVPGTRHAPWLRLTDWEMAKLRKQMKKNAMWTPSQTMVERELSVRHRGEANKRKAMAEAAEKGVPFIDEDQETSAAAAPATASAGEDVVSTPTDVKPKEGDELINKGMKLNQAKKLKREAQASQAKSESVEPISRDVVDLERANQQINETGNLMKTLFAPPTPLTNPPKKKADPPKTAKKRKRDPSPEAPGETKEHTPVPSVDAPPQPKKLKIIPPANAKSQQTPIPLPSSASPVPPPSATNTMKLTITQVPLAPAGPSTPGPAPSPQKLSPALPSPTENRKVTTQPPVAIAPTPVSTAAASRSRRPSVAPKPKSPDETQAPLLPRLAPRPASRGSASAKAASAEPPVKQESMRYHNTRRASNVSLPVNSEPAPHPAPALAPRTRRKPAPGPVATDGDGSGNTTVAKRKKKGHKRSKSEEGQAGDAMEVDPDEPRYCFCNDVSYGDMIACSNELTVSCDDRLPHAYANTLQCERQWFHFDCVGITTDAMPGRRQKWFCPECQKKLKVDQRGNHDPQAGRKPVK